MSNDSAAAFYDRETGTLETLAEMQRMDDLDAIALQYAAAYASDPAMIIGMIAARLERLDALYLAIEPFINDPSRILANVPPPLRAMLGL